MRKALLLVSSLFILSVSAFAQCGTPVNSISETFNDGAIPPCWYSYGVTPTFNRLNFNVNGNGDRWIVLPLVENCKGILEFDGRNATNGQQGVSNFQIGVVATQGGSSMSSFELVEVVPVYPTTSGGSVIYAHYVVDFSAYTGSSQYIAFVLPQSPSQDAHIENVTYQSACLSSSVTAVAQDFSVQLDATGNATITAEQVDNGSSYVCGDPAISIDVYAFNCDNIGPNTVTLTADDGQGHVETATATVTVLPAIDDETVTATASEVCDGSATTITTGSSVFGIEYYLRDDADDSVIDGPVIGTGSGLSFNTSALSTATTFNVFGETPAFVPTALDFDGVNDYVDLGADNRGITTALTINMWIKTTTTGAAEYIAGKYNGANGFLLYMNTGGKLLIDGRDGAGGYKSSGASLTSINDGQWHYISGIIDVSLGIWAVGVDGVMETVGTMATGVTLASPAALTVGTYTTNYADVTIDMVNVWNFGQGQAQVQNSMNTCLVGTESGLVALLHMDEGSGAVATDASATGIDGVVTNMAAGAWVAGTPDLCTVQSVVSCDREMTQTATVSIATAYSLSETASLCSGESFTFPDGTVQNNITSQVVHTSNLVTVVASCDSIIETTVNVNPSYDLSSTSSVCSGESFTFPDGTVENNITAQVVHTSNLTTVGFACDSIIETTVNVTTVDVATSQNGGTLTADQTGATYQWVDCDNSNAAFSGEVSQDFTPTASGNYAVEVTVGNCTETSACVGMIVTGIVATQATDLQIFPNPATQQLNVVSSESILAIQVYTISGQHIHTFSQNAQGIDVSSLANGMYLLVVQTESGLTQQRFVKH